MSTENMRKLIMLAESLNEDDRQDAMDRFPDDYAGDMEDLATRSEDEYCPTCHGWGEVLPPDVEQDMDNVIPCPDCTDEHKPRLKSQVIKDLANEIDMDWTDLGLSDVEPEDLKGFPKINESKASDTKAALRIAQEAAEHYREEAGEYDYEEFGDDEDAAYFDNIVSLIKSKQFERAAYMFSNLDTIVEETLQGLLSDEQQIALHNFVKAHGHGGFEDWDSVYYMDESLTEEQSEFRLKDIVGADNFAELVSDMNTGGIDYSAAYFTPLYWHFLDEYPDEIPVGSRTGRPEDPEQYVLDNLERYHSEEIKSYMNTPDMDESNCGVCGETFKWEGSPDEEMCPRCTQEYLGEASCPCGKEGCECGPDCDCEPVEEGFTLDAIVESLLDERGQPKDYEMSDEELAAEIEDETSEFERDHIDPEIEDEELGLRFD